MFIHENLSTYLFESILKNYALASRHGCKICGNYRLEGEIKRNIDLILGINNMLWDWNLAEAQSVEDLR